MQFVNAFLWHWPLSLRHSTQSLTHSLSLCKPWHEVDIIYFWMTCFLHWLLSQRTSSDSIPSTQSIIKCNFWSKWPIHSSIPIRRMHGNFVFVWSRPSSSQAVSSSQLWTQLTTLFDEWWDQMNGRIFLPSQGKPNSNSSPKFRIIIFSPLSHPNLILYRNWELLFHFHWRVKGRDCGSDLHTHTTSHVLLSFGNWNI